MPEKPVKLNLHFMPNTHLDREWTLDFQHSRRLTVEFLDNLIEVMKKVPDYHFLLDAQVVPLEDYFEIRPENEAAMRRLIRQGRLNIGPWYTAPDMNCITGESTARNLLLGHRIGRSYGPVMKVGYTPFGFVHISQLPQIYREFGIDFCIFYRGINRDAAPMAEFYWEGADGSRLLASRLGKGTRCSFYFNVYRKAFFKVPERLDRCYHWAEGQLPFKLCDEEVRFDQGTLIKPRRQLDPSVIGGAFRELVESDRQDFSTPEIPFMNGMDTSTPDIREDDILRLCQSHLKKGERFFHSSMPRYAAAVKKALQGRRLVTLKGEMQYPERWITEGLRQTFVNTVSTRTRLKRLVAKAENHLVRRAEPWATVAYLLGATWPQPYLRLAWKEFLKCHPHDTIAGCTIDRAEEDATARLRQVLSLSQVVTEESLGHIQARIDTSDVGPDTVLLTVFNPSPFERSEVVTTYVDIPRELRMKRFGLWDDRERPVNCTRSATGNVGKIFRDKTDLALYSTSDEYQVRFLAEKVPALGYKTYQVRKGSTRSPGAALSPEPRVLENEHLRARINDDGTVDLTHKDTGVAFKGLHYFEDGGEAGHPWQHFAPEKDELITSRGTKARIALVENNDLLARYRVHVSLRVPETTVFDEEKRRLYPASDGAARSKTRKTMDIYSDLTLRKQGRSLEVETRVINTCRNHRLRVMMPTGLAAKHSYAETPFDVVKRVIDRGPDHPFAGAQNPCYPFLRFVDLNDGRSGLAFVGNGLREYEAVDDAVRTLAITLIRAVEIRLCTTNRWDRVPGDLIQSLGENVFHYALYPHAGGWETSDLLQEADRVNLPLITAEAGPERGGTLPKTFGFLALSGQGLVLSGLKRCEDNPSVILRVFNPTEQAASGTVTLFKKVKSAAYVTMNEVKVKGRRPIVKKSVIRLDVAPKKVVSLSLVL